MNTITISKRRIEKEGGIVLLPMREYRRLSERAVPEYYLTGRKAKVLDRLVTEGLREHAAGNTIKAPSLKEALRIYGKNRGR